MSNGDNNGHVWDGKERRYNGNGNGRSAFERHAQTALATLIALGIAWLANAVIDLGKDQARTSGIVTTRLDQLQKSNENTQGQILQITSDRVTISDIRRLEERVDRLERERRK